jgi:beta-glucosidase
VVLLRNDGVLPLTGGGLGDTGGSRVAGSRRIHVTGPFATATDALFGTWTLDGRAEDAVTIADAFRERFAGVADADGEGAVSVTVDDARHIDETLLLVREADVVVACFGEHPLRSGEANSVTSVDLPPGQVESIEALARVSRRLVVVVLTGRPLALERLAHLGSALVLVFHPGLEGGHGIVDVLAGDVPASGRLPASLPWTTGQVPLHHDHLPTGRPLDPDGPVGRYRDHRDTPQYPFGFGLGYGSVTYQGVELSAQRLGAGDVVQASARLTNTGAHPVIETAQLYVRAELSPVSRPVSELAGVRRLALGPGEERVVTFDVDAALLAYRDADGRARCDGGPFTIRIAPYAGGGVTARLDGGGGSDPTDRPTQSN